jgi:hypothetical protein
MLKKIICDKFIENEIVFHNGLNVVLGDDIASNSIGKTTLLMIIDFIFGGNDYINKNKDVIENLGHHTFNFIFQFGDELLYFSRNTENPKEITMCDKYFNLIKKISITEYTNRLKQYYKCEIDDFSFRDIIGRFFRIYGKENLNEKKPIQYYEKETFSESIINLIKLFKLYPTIKNLEEQINDIKNKKKFIEEAVKRNFVPNVTKSIFNTNKDKIDKLNSELSDLKKSIISSSVSIENIITQEVIILKQQKNNLLNQKNVLISRENRIKKNLDNNKNNVSPEIEKFAQYYPNIDIEKIKEVQSFHNNLVSVLNKEMKTSCKEIAARVAVIEENIKQLDKKILEKLNVKDAPKIAIDRIIELSNAIKQLETENGYYTNLEELKSNEKSLKAQLTNDKIDILKNISNCINEKMENTNSIIYNNTRRAPVINLEENRYQFKTEGDTGTGTAYASLINFDLAILNLTCLPALAHDLVLLKNIENSALRAIIKLYSESQKQIFIALDKLNSYDDVTQKIVDKYKVIQLEKNKTLFIKNWKSNSL